MTHRFRRYFTLIAAICLSISFGGLACAQAETSVRKEAVSTLPSITDPEINAFDVPHFSWAPAGNTRNLLVLFLPGTGGKPRANFPFTGYAASLGFHAIFLMYPDDVAAQQMCSRSPDPDATMKFRLDIIRGGSRTPPASSILNRFTKLLRYLADHYPRDSWGQFLLKDGNPDWSKVVVSGQSQGGGHAYVLGKYFCVNKVIMFGSPKDYSFYFNRTAVGFDPNTKTPMKRFFAFNHKRDPKGPYDREMKILDDIGLTKYGVADVDRAQIPYGNAHVLFTDAEVSDAEFHSAPISGKLPVCLPVWNYMLNSQ